MRAQGVCALSAAGFLARALLALAIALLAAGLPASAQVRECPAPGSGPTLDAAALRALRADSQGLEVPPGARVKTPIDRTLLCPDAAEGAPCLVQGLLDLSCADLGEGVALDGVLVDGDLRLDGTRVRGRGMRVRDVDVIGALSLAGARIDGGLELARASIAGELLAPLVRIGGDARLEGVRAVEGASLSSADIGGALAIERSVFGSLDLSSVEAGSLRVAQSAVIEELWIERSRLDEGLWLELVSVGGTLYASGLEIGGDMSVEGTRLAASLELGGRVKGRLELRGLQVRGDIELLALELGGRLELVSCGIAGEFAVDESSFSRGLRFEYGEFGKDVDLLGASIEGELAFVGVSFGGILYLDEDQLDAPPRLTDCVPPDPRPR